MLATQAGICVATLAFIASYLAACLGAFGGGGAFVRVEEGQVACIYTLGQLEAEVLRPGNHFLLAPPPPMRLAKIVSVRPTTLRLTNVECSSSDGVAIPIPTLELVHQTPAGGVYETVKAHGVEFESFLGKQLRAEVVQLCSQWSLGDVVIQRFHEFDDVLEARLRTTIAATAPGLKVVV